MSADLAAERCPRCQGPTTIYYGHRDTWTVCRTCRVGWWCGTGYDHDAADPDRRPPPGAIDLGAASPFWTEIDP